MEFLFELVLQLVIEFLVELGFHATGRAANPDAGPPSWGSAFAYLVFGILLGFISLAIFPILYARETWLQIANLVLIPFAVGGVMSLLGSWRRKRGQPLVRLDRFTYAYVFALTIATVRFTWGS